MIQHYSPRSLSPARLDRYLASGWFRSTNMLYRSEVLCLDGGIYAPVNIRLKLQEYKFSKSLRKTYSKHNRAFTHQIKKVRVNDFFGTDKTQLYQQHCHRFKGFIFDSLVQFFFNHAAETIFDTYEVSVYDNGKLIALSYFDLGEKSVASLLSVYDLSDYYKKYSLGLYTMLLEVDYTQNIGKKFYYPGYVLDQESDFDYKLRLKDYYYYDWKGRWKKPFNKYKQEKWLVHAIREKYEIIEKYLIESNIEYEKRFYPYYALAYSPDNFFNNLVKGMAFYILSFDEQGFPREIIEYDNNTDMFSHYKIRLLYAFEDMTGMNFSEDFQDFSVYTLDIFVYDELLNEVKDISNLF